MNIINYNKKNKHFLELLQTLKTDPNFTVFMEKTAIGSELYEKYEKLIYLIGEDYAEAISQTTKAINKYLEKQEEFNSGSTAPGSGGFHSILD